jgi:hypothetical protein
MAVFALGRSAKFEAESYGGLAISDQELVRRLRDRDGEMPGKAPAHLAKGRCKYASFYAQGDCPWCLVGRLRNAA